MNMIPAYYLCSTGFWNCRVKFYHENGVPNENYHSIHSHSIHSFFGWILTWVRICCLVSYAIRKIYIWTISNSRDNNFHHDCYKLYIIISWVAICKIMQIDIIFKTIFEYIHKRFCFMHTNTFCKYRKQLRASPRVHLVIKWQLHFYGYDVASVHYSSCIQYGVCNLHLAGHR